MTDTFCPLLFQHLATHPYGGVTHCCIADHRNQASNAYDLDELGRKRIYNVNHDKLSDLYNSESFRAARKQVLSGEIPPACNRCFDEERSGITSKRQAEISNYPDFTVDRARSITQEDGTINDPQFEFVELRLGNTCNVKCRTCNPASSSKWRDDYQNLESSLDFITRYGELTGFRWPEREEFWDDLYNHTHDVKVFYINGGEPMLIKQHFRFLERLVAAKRTDVVLWYNINMTMMNQQVLDLWGNFREVRVSASIDDLGDRNHYIRYPTDWNAVQRNMDTLQSIGWIKLDVTQTVSFMNYHNLANFHEYFNKERGLFVHHNIVHDPDFLSPKVLPREIVKVAQEQFYRLPIRTHQILMDAAGQEQNLLGWQRAISYTQNLDQIRNQDIRQSLLEFGDMY